MSGNSFYDGWVHGIAGRSPKGEINTARSTMPTTYDEACEFFVLYGNVGDVIQFRSVKPSQQRLDKAVNTAIIRGRTLKEASAAEKAVQDYWNVSEVVHFAVKDDTDPTGTKHNPLCGKIKQDGVSIRFTSHPEWVTCKGCQDALMVLINGGSPDGNTTPEARQGGADTGSGSTTRSPHPND